MSEFLRTFRRAIGGVLPGRLKTVDDTGVVQKIQVDHGAQGPDGSLSIVDKVPHVQHFGFGSHPPADTDVVVICIAGDRSKAIAIASNHQQYRLGNLAEGDSALYDQRGAYLWLTANGPVLDAAGLDVVIQNAGNVTITASGDVAVSAQGNATVTADKVVIDCDDVNLGATGGQAVARVGDAVANGVITGGSSKVRAA